MAEVAVPPTNGSLPTDKPTTDENAAPNGSTSAAADGENVTVFHDPNNFNVKHPLMHEWTLWFTKPPSGKVWAAQASVGSRQVLANTVSG